LDVFQLDQSGPDSFLSAEAVSAQVIPEPFEVLLSFRDTLA
jgi:hypothetical protein